MNIALLIIDMQQTFYDEKNYKEGLKNALEYINETSELFRSNDLPVIVIQDIEAAEGPGSPGFENISELIVKDSDIRLEKEFSNSFWKTDLENILKAKDIEFLVISGFAAEYCVLFTLNGAQERGYGASLLQHGIAGVDPEIIKQTQSIRPTISLDALEFFLKK